MDEAEARIDADIRGSVRADLCDAFGKPLEGYELAKSIPLCGDSSKRMLRWEGGRTTAPYQYDAVSLFLEMNNTTLYACVP